uniref:Alanine--tRNA ligase n=1 Tax=Anabas testudineus TaxID=64144 RepID=A0A7N6AGF0_ANATE
MLRLLLRRLRPLSRLRSLFSARSDRSFSGYVPGLPAARVRSTFLDFFREKHGHLLVPSSPVRPRGDPSLLFVNAGMNQFKPIFLGRADPRSEMASYRRVVNSQKCVRAGGKHNDLEDVGRDVYHHTFFEMLGNWSFGDYFKEEACSMAWSLLTEHYGIPADRLYVSYFSGDAESGLTADEETRQIWLDIGVPPKRLLPFGLKENFWEMGDTGPCGPCTEIHYDHVGGRDASSLVNTDGPDVVEIWNLVFMQYNRDVDRSLLLLPQFSVDTGMGLERLVSVLQGKQSNYDTDLFTPLLHAIHQRSGVGPYSGRTGADLGKVDTAYRVVADHIRTLSVCIADGVHPGMSGAEYVHQSAVRSESSANQLSDQRPPPISCQIRVLCQSAVRSESSIMDVINENEAQFLSSLQQGTRLIHRTLNRMDNKHEVFPGSVAWSLHRDLGFPLDLVDLMLEERGVRVDHQELDRLMAENQKVASELQSGVRSQVTLDVVSLAELHGAGVPHTDDSLKYRYTLDQDRYVFPACFATVLALYDGQTLVSEVTEGQRCGVILDQTCFYSEQGGQSHDQGYFTRDGLQDVLYPVESVIHAGGYVVHEVTAADSLKTGDQVQLHLDQGSLSVSQLQQVERCVNDIISANQIVHSQELPLHKARTIRGLRTVDEVYPDPVRVVSVGAPVSELLDDQTDRQTSVELCCGTHLLQTGSIQDLVIVSERQLVKGISRIVAVTGPDAARAREAGQVLSQNVDYLSNRLSGLAPTSLDSSQRFAKEVGVLSDAVDNTPIPQWQRRDLQSRLRTLQRTSNTAVRKLETREVIEFLSTLKSSLMYKMFLVLKSFISVELPWLHLSPSLRTVTVVIWHLIGYGLILNFQHLPSFQASDWAVAVCHLRGGSAGGSALVAKGTGNGSDISEALSWAKTFARQKIQL